MIQISEASVFEKQLERIQLITGRRTDAELASFFGIDRSTVYRARRQKKIPADWLVILSRIKFVFPEWVLTGNGPCFIPTSGDVYEDYEQVSLKRAEEKALRCLSSKRLADELLRRIALSQAEVFSRKRPGSRSC